MTEDFRRFSGTETYLTSEGLESAVNCAVVLERPLLVRGEPGTGKTLLAEAVSEALGMRLLRWNIRSTTRAQDGLYVYDTVQRLYDSRFGDKDVNDIRQYIKLGPMGEAFSKDRIAPMFRDSPALAEKIGKLRGNLADPPQPGKTPIPISVRPNFADSLA